MTRIRDALTAALPSIHAGKATAEQYRALAQQTDDQLAFLFQNCKLRREADAMLHIILADIIAGALKDILAAAKDDDGFSPNP